MAFSLETSICPLLGTLGSAPGALRHSTPAFDPRADAVRTTATCRPQPPKGGSFTLSAVFFLFIPCRFIHLDSFSLYSFQYVPRILMSSYLHHRSLTTLSIVYLQPAPLTKSAQCHPFSKKLNLASTPSLAEKSILTPMSAMCVTSFI